MTHQNLRLGKCWKLFWATLNFLNKFTTFCLTFCRRVVKLLIGDYPKYQAYVVNYGRWCFPELRGSHIWVKTLPHLHMVTAETWRCLNALFIWKVNFETKSVLPIEKVQLFILSRNALMLKHLIIQFSLFYLSSGHFWEGKTKQNLKLSALNVVAVERWSLTRGSK